jgi:TetR/AcrR family tetracycline transcriptional repressor
VAASKRTQRREEILEAALAIADRDGLEGLTMRKLCADLGVSAPILYRHFADKASIVEALVIRLMGDDPLGEPGAFPPRKWVQRVFVTMHRELTAHAGLMSLLSTEGPMLDSGLQVTESVLEALARLGLDAPTRGRAFQVLMGYTLGSVVMARGTDVGGAQVAEALKRHPRMLESAIHLDVRNPGNFEGGLQVLLSTLLPEDDS